MSGRIQTRASDVLIAALATGLIAGCASTSQQTGTHAANTELTAADIYMWRVEEAAKRMNVDVVWVNPPNRNRRSELGNAFEKEIQLRTPAKPDDGEQ